MSIQEVRSVSTEQFPKDFGVKLRVRSPETKLKMNFRIEQDYDLVEHTKSGFVGGRSKYTQFWVIDSRTTSKLGPFKDQHHAKSFIDSFVKVELKKAIK